MSGGLGQIMGGEAGDKRYQMVPLRKDSEACRDV
jgi:hypothetical protein